MSQLCIHPNKWMRKRECTNGEIVQSGSCTLVICDFSSWDAKLGCAECPEMRKQLTENCTQEFSWELLLNLSQFQPPPGRNFFDFTIVITGSRMRLFSPDDDVGVEVNVNSTCNYGNGTMGMPNLDSCVEMPCLPNSLCLIVDPFGDLGPNQRKEYSLTTMEILTLSGLSISLIALIITLWTYYRISLLNLNMIRLQAHSFTAHLCAIIGFLIAGIVSLRAASHWLCKVAAIFSHFAFLSVFSWMHIIAWTLLASIIGTANLTTLDNQWSWKLASIIAQYAVGWIPPLVITLISAGLDFLWAPGFMEYGEGGLCWIGSKMGLLYMFLVSSGGVGSGSNGHYVIRFTVRIPDSQ